MVAYGLFAALVGCGRLDYELRGVGQSLDSKLDGSASSGAGSMDDASSMPLTNAMRDGSTGDVANSEADGSVPTPTDAASMNNGSLPPLPCADPLVWYTDFSSDPTLLDDNDDGQPDWQLRSGMPFDTGEITNGIWHPSTDNALDTNPPLNFTERTQALVRMRDTSSTPEGQLVPAGYGGALFWVNFDYTPTDFLAVYTSATHQNGNTRQVASYAHTATGGQLLAGPVDVTDAFVVLEFDIDPGAQSLELWLDGNRITVGPMTRQTVLNADQFATVIAPAGHGEFDEVWVATCSQ